MRALSMLLLLLAPLSGWCAINDQPPQSGAAGTYENLQAVCKNLAPLGPQGNIDTLSKIYPITTNNEIREAITTASGLYWMLRQQIAESVRYCEFLRKTFPNSNYQPLLEKDANLVACTNCHEGVAQISCPDCGGTGKCRVCGGRGKVAGITGGTSTLGGGMSGSTTIGGGRPIGTVPSRIGNTPNNTATTPRRLDDTSSLQACATCGGSGTCKTCKGTKLASGRCPICHGFGTIFTPQTRLAYVDVLEHLNNLAFAASMTEHGMVLQDGHWVDAATASQILKKRSDDRADFIRVAAEAERAKDYTTAFQLFDRVLARHPDSTFTGDVQRLVALLHAEAADKKFPEKSVRGLQQMTAAGTNPHREIGIIVDAILTACRRGTNTPMLLTGNPILPEKPVKWVIAEPELIDRTARVVVQIDRLSRSGFPITEPWEFRLTYENIQWKVWQACQKN